MTLFPEELTNQLWEVSNRLLNDISKCFEGLVESITPAWEAIKELLDECIDSYYQEPRRRPKRPSRYEKQELYFRRSQPVKRLVRTNRFREKR